MLSMQKRKQGCESKTSPSKNGCPENLQFPCFKLFHLKN